MAPKRKIKNSYQPQIFENKSDVFEGKRYFKDPKKISDHLICSICTDVFDEPWSLTCGHAFCKDCIDPWLKTNNTCPIDRKAVSLPHCYKNIPIANIIGDLIIACPWRPYGCELIDRYYIVKDHKEKCCLNPNKMDPVMRSKMRKVSQDLPVSQESTAPKKEVSALDELLAQLENEPLSQAENEPIDESMAEDDVTALPEVDLPPLAMRMYLKQDDTSNLLVGFLKKH